MKKSLLLVLLIAFISFRLAAQESSFSRARIHLDVSHTVFQLLQLGVTLDHGVHKKTFIENDFSSEDLQKIRQAGFRYELLIEDVSKFYEAQNLDQSSPKVLLAPTCGVGGSNSSTSYQTPSNFRLGSMGGYLTYQELLNQLDSMALKYPNLISARQPIGSTLTHEGRPIYWVRISDNPNVDENEPESFYNALHHAREPMGLSQLVFYMWYLLENYNTDPNIRFLVDNSEMYFVPCINPDGYVYNQTTNPNGGGMWRKNRRNNGGSFGVDLNRNYGYRWAYDNTGSSGTASSDTYRGPSAFSEPETQNIRDFCNAHNFVLALNYHSYGNLLVYPWAYNSGYTPDSTEFKAFSAMMTKQNSFLTGTGDETVGYNSNGDADDWIYGEQTTKNKVLSLTPEVGSGQFGFWPASNQIINLCQSTVWQNLSMSYLLLNFGLATDKSAPVFAQQQQQIAFEITRYGYTAGNMTVSLVPVSSNIQSVGGAKNFNLNQLEKATDSISITLSPSIQSGDVVTFMLKVDNGGITIQDTIRKVYGNYQTMLTDAGNNMNNWTNLGTGSNWQVTSSTFHSAPSSITDSKNGNYANNANNQILLNQSFNLSNAVDASVSFWAKWDLENDYDYVQVMAANSSGVFSALCGNYTNMGTSFQDLNQPLFDGQQNTWVQENMSLNDFLGSSQVVLKIRLRSDQWMNADGFYFDDMVVNILENLPSGLGTVRRHYPLLGQNIPNPASQQVFIPFNLEGAMEQVSNAHLKLRVVNAMGQLMALISVDALENGINLEVGDWPRAVYFYQLVGSNGWTSNSQKMILD